MDEVHVMYSSIVPDSRSYYILSLKISLLLIRTYWSLTFSICIALAKRQDCYVDCWNLGALETPKLQA